MPNHIFELFSLAGVVDNNVYFSNIVISASDYPLVVRMGSSELLISATDEMNNDIRLAIKVALSMLIIIKCGRVIVYLNGKCYRIRRLETSCVLQYCNGSVLVPKIKDFSDRYHIMWQQCL